MLSTRASPRTQLVAAASPAVQATLYHSLDLTKVAYQALLGRR